MSVIYSLVFWSVDKKRSLCRMLEYTMKFVQNRNYLGSRSTKPVYHPLRYVFIHWECRALTLCGIGYTCSSFRRMAAYFSAARI